MVDEYNKKTLEFLMESTHSAHLIHFFVYSSPFSVFFTFLWDAIFLSQASLFPDSLEPCPPTPVSIGLDDNQILVPFKQEWFIYKEMMYTVWRSSNKLYHT